MWDSLDWRVSLLHVQVEILQELLLCDLIPFGFLLRTPSALHVQLCLNTQQTRFSCTH